MSTDVTTRAPLNQEPEDRANRRPYEAPAIIWKEDISSQPALAMACARSVFADAQCAAGGLAS